MQHMRGSKSIFRFLVAALVFGGWALLLLCLTPHPDLIQTATKTAFSGDAPYQWLSDHELLVFDRAPDQGWNCCRLDTLTGTKTPLPELQRSLPRSSDMPCFLKVSPDGKRVVYYGLAAPQVFTMDGTQLPSFQRNTPQDHQNIANDTPFWLANGRIVFLPYFNNEIAPPSGKLLRLPFLDTQNTIEDRRQKTEDGSAFIANPKSKIRNVKFLNIPCLPEFGAAEYYSPPMLTASGLLYAYASAYEENDMRTLLLLPLLPGASATKHVIHAPPVLTFAARNSAYGEPVQVSPQGNHVFWLFQSRIYTPPLRALLHRFIPHVEAPSYQWMSLQVSRLDGSDMREVGGIAVEMKRLKMPFNTMSAGRSRQDEIQDVRWLPDGKQLSFCYHQALYTVGGLP